MYRLYYDFAERVTKLQSHQILAINRGEKEEALKVAVQADGPGGIVKKTAHPTCPVMPPVLVLTATVSA